MGRLFALADLHLSLAGLKPMERFGDLWRDHAERMAAAWDRTVTDADTVLLAGDISWARNAVEVTPDLDWIERRPGRKLLLRGNHDGWWSSLAKVRRLLPPGCEPLQNDSHRVEDWVVVGARGWIAPDDPGSTDADERVFWRELERFRLSLVHADRVHGSQLPRLAMVHYPPWTGGREPTRVVDLMRRSGVRVCVYGHLHGEDHRLAVQGDRAGIRFVFVAADAVGFAPVRLELPCLGEAQGRESQT
jgi:predicted phosphohydrolase